VPPAALKTSAVGHFRRDGDVRLHPDDPTTDIAARREEARAKVTESVGKLFQAGGKRLAG